MLYYTILRLISLLKNGFFFPLIIHSNFYRLFKNVGICIFPIYISLLIEGLTTKAMSYLPQVKHRRINILIQGSIICKMTAFVKKNVNKIYNYNLQYILATSRNVAQGPISQIYFPFPKFSSTNTFRA